MKEPDSHLKSCILGYFSQQGVPAEEIPAGTGKTPDLLLCKGAPDETLLEIKQKEDDREEIEELQSDLNAGGVVSRSKALSPWNRADTIIRNAIRQMEAIDPEHRALRVVWVHCVGHYSQVYAERLKATVYGMQDLVSSEIEHLAHCFYFHESTFFRSRNKLEGVIIWASDEAFLYLNDHSPRFQQMLESRLSKCFLQGLYSPAQFTDVPSMLIHDGADPRGNDDVSLAYLRRKYSLSHLQRMDMGHHSLMIRRPEIV